MAFIVSIFPLKHVQAKPLTCAELVSGIEGKGNVGTDYGAILIGVAQTSQPRACIPNSTMLGVLEAVFIHWADQHPKQMNTDAWACAAKAFSEAYPCSPSR